VARLKVERRGPGTYRKGERNSLIQIPTPVFFPCQRKKKKKKKEKEKTGIGKKGKGKGQGEKRLELYTGIEC